MEAFASEATTEKFVYSTTLYQTPAIPNYSSFADRKRLSGPNLRMFFRIMARWKVSPRDMRLLLGGISSRCYKQLKARQKGRILNQDRLLRVIYIIGIDKALHILLDRKQADRWVQMPSKDRRFCGTMPLRYMIQRNIPAIWKLNRLLQARTAEKLAKSEVLHD
jgi:hypothetical protein